LQNLETLRIALRARSLYHHLINEKAPLDPFFETLNRDDPAALAARKEAEHQTRKELGDAYKFVETGDIATIEALERELEIRERLEAMLERCLKRLLFARGVKSVSPAPASPPSKRVPGPSRADSDGFHA
jgi:hypothetical protein